jgi:glycosyltransferase involved in cell wall biosynthesis
MRRSTRDRPPASFIAWSSVSGRSVEIAAALGGEARCFYDFGFVSAALIPLRYAASTLRTVLYLVLRRPRAVIVTNPPVFPALIAWLYGLVARAPIVLDSHPSGFGLHAGKRMVNLMLPLHRFLIPRARGVIVTVDELADEVRRHGGQPVIVHEAPPLWTAPPPPPLGARPTILFVGIFARDEPVDLVVEAARRLPSVDVLVTGDLRKCPPELRERPAPNLRFVGFLDPAAYRAALAGADVVMTLTTSAESVDRGANEAVFARRPLIVSDWPAARRYFPFAVHVPNTLDGVVEGIERAVREHDTLREQTEPALAAQTERWHRQLDDLRTLVTGP